MLIGADIDPMQAYWQVDLDSVKVDGTEAVGSISSIIDTGTTQIVGDDDNVAAVYQQISGSADGSQYGEGLYTSMSTLHSYLSPMLMLDPGSPLRLQHADHALFRWSRVYRRPQHLQPRRS